MSLVKVMVAVVTLEVQLDVRVGVVAKVGAEVREEVRVPHWRAAPLGLRASPALAAVLSVSAVHRRT